MRYVWPGFEGTAGKPPLQTDAVHLVNILLKYLYEMFPRVTLFVLGRYSNTPPRTIERVSNNNEIKYTS